MTFTEFETRCYRKIKRHKFLLKGLLNIRSLFGFNKYNIRGCENRIIHDGALLKRVKFDIIGNNNQVYLHEESLIQNATVFIRGSNHRLFVGRHCIVKGGSFWFEDTDCTISIGDHTTIECAHLAATENGKSIDIGCDCMLAYDIEVRTGDSHTIIDLSIQKRINHAKNVQIDDHVWIGADVKILKGVSIGKNSVIGTGSVVTKPIPDNCIAAGIPAKVIRDNVTWERPRL